MQEGVIKFTCTWIKELPPDAILIKELNAWRNKLYQHKLIGMNNEGIGYGNISIRFQKNKFIITGSGTGKIACLTNEHYALVTDYKLNKNTLTAKGLIVASSESLTHAVLYKNETGVNAVIHIHHSELWKKLMETHPSTNRNVEYGTPAMANEIIRLLRETNLAEEKIFAMGGHKDGVISFGKDLNEAGKMIFDSIPGLALY